MSDGKPSDGLERTLPAPGSTPVEVTAAEEATPLGATMLAVVPPNPHQTGRLPDGDRARYQLLGEVGRGGLGRVLRARDTHLDRTVAIKELLDGTPGASAAQARFAREALITARLQHPSIVPIYDAGQAGDGPFYAMKLVAGRSLAEAVDAAPTLDARLALLPAVIAVADAMAYAHDEGIIHRDLKPANVLVGRFGETVVIDWGLAKDLASDEPAPDGPYRASPGGAETVVGAVMGTPAYMPPEQALGGDADERADVYALGAMLYHVLCGVAPHAGSSREAMLAQVVAGEITPIAVRVPGVPIDLAAIVDKAMATDRAARYRTAGALAEDLHRFQTGQLVGAHAYSRRERRRRWLRRHRVPVTVGLIATLALGALGAWSVARIVGERELAEDAAAKARVARAAAEVQRDAARGQAMLVRAQQYASSGHTGEEIAVLRALAARSPADARLAIDAGLIWKAHQRLARAVGDDPTRVVSSPDGTRFVAAQA
ncbi:MAG: serine/threonine-protein kinase, partial [Proteobacteria bacterium]|nr:serine/threonine-protein kinase [Pseudomonadota bacterium]